MWKGVEERQLEQDKDKEKMNKEGGNYFKKGGTIRASAWGGDKGRTCDTEIVEMLE